MPAFLLVLAVGTVGVLHTLVPDHWLPIALVARQQGWTRSQTARAAFGAGIGHVVSTLLIGIAVWLAGLAFAVRFGAMVGIVSSGALIAFGLWIAVGSLLELRRGVQLPGGHTHAHAAHPHPHAEYETPHGHDHEHGYGHGHGHDHGGGHEPVEAASGAASVRASAAEPHRHQHRHADGLEHAHLHSHGGSDAHDLSAAAANATPLHDHSHKASGRTALLLILGSSPMIEGIPAFFAAARYGIGLIAVMSLVFAAATIATYVGVCVYSAERLQVVSIGPVERYGEVLSGGFIALVGVIFLIWPVL